MTKVRLVWEMEVDDSWNETSEECIELARTELSTQINDLEFEVVERTNRNETV